ncbi:thrombospondin-2-like [Styela clava]
MRIQSILTHSEILLITFSTLILQTTGIWSPWSDWSACSVSCGKGEQSRFRISSVDSSVMPKIMPRECGKPCDDGKSEIQQVIWSPWSDWSLCSVSCGKGEQTRVRICLDNSCEVPERQQRECGNPCDAERSEIQQGAWSTWSDWSACSVSCGKGEQTRIRVNSVDSSTMPKIMPRECGKPCDDGKSEIEQGYTVLKRFDPSMFGLTS